MVALATSAFANNERYGRSADADPIFFGLGGGLGSRRGLGGLAGLGSSRGLAGLGSARGLAGLSNACGATANRADLARLAALGRFGRSADVGL